MQVTSPYDAELALLAAGAVIEQISEAPLAYRLQVGREAVPICQATSRSNPLPTSRTDPHSFIG